MALTRGQIRDSIERAGDAHWQALIRHHTDAYPESPPTPGDVARAEAERLNALGLADNPNLTLVESRVERVPPGVRITHVFEDRDKGTRFETEPFADYERARGSAIPIRPADGYGASLANSTGCRVPASRRVY
jgi:hypothetical protein